MHLITSFINNPVKVATAVLLLVLFGILAVVDMPVELTPKVEKQWLSISTMWPGAGPEEVEREIIYEQERHLNAIPGMKEITSSSSSSRGRVELNFDISTDMNDALVRVSSRLQQVARYPETALEPTIFSGADDASAIATFNLIPRPPDASELADFARRHPQHEQLIAQLAALSPPTLLLQELIQRSRDIPELGSLLPDDLDIVRHSRFAEDDIAAALGRVEGVARVWVWGAQEDEMRVTVDPSRLAVLRLTLSDVRDVLRARNHDLPAGQMNEGKRRFDVRILGRYTSPEQVEQEVLTVVDGTPVTIGDVARVTLVRRSARDTAASHFATRCLRLRVIKEAGSNLLDVMAGVREAVRAMNSGILKQRGLLLHQSYDDTEYVHASIRSVQQNMILGAILTTLVLLLFLRSGRSTLIVGTAIPVSIVGTFLCLRLLDRSLNVVSLAGMSFAIGMLVDNAVVVLENIYRYHQQGLRPADAARRGTLDVWGATLASTLTTLAVFVPILFVREEAGQLFRDIALAISCGVGLSLLVSVIVIPTAAARLLRSPTEAVGPGRARSIVSRFLVPADHMARWTAAGIVRLNEFIQASVQRQLLSVLVFVGGGSVLAWLLIPPVEYLPGGNRNSVRARLVPPPGYNVTQMQTIADRFYQQIRPLLPVTGLSEKADEESSLHETSDPPRIVDYTFGASAGRGYISVKAEDPARARELVDWLRAASEVIPGIQCYVSQSGLFQNGWGESARSIEVHITGPDLDRLVDLGAAVRQDILARIDGASVYPIPSLEKGKPELRVEPDKLRVAEAGLTTDDIAYTVDACIESAWADTYVLDGDEIDLTLAVRDEQGGFLSLEQIPVATGSGDILPLSALATVRMASGLDSIRHINRQRAVTLRVAPPDDIPLATAIGIIENDIVRPLQERGELGGIYHISLSGSADSLRQTWQALRLNFLIAVLITYLLMAALFESWVYPLVIMVSLPLAAVGGILGLRITGLFTVQHLDILTMLGFVILTGTVVNNAILIVHQALNLMREHGMPPGQAVVDSVRTRIRPIFMTTITTTIGLMPLVFSRGAGAELYRGLGSVVLGGLVVSTLFTLFLVPSLFSLMYILPGIRSRPPTPVRCPSPVATERTPVTAEHT